MLIDNPLIIQFVLTILHRFSLDFRSRSLSKLDRVLLSKLDRVTSQLLTAQVQISPFPQGV